MSCIFTFGNDKSFKEQIANGEKKLIQVRQQASQLYFAYHLSKTMISRRLGVGKPFVIKWTQSPDQDFTRDERGWPKGKPRRWNQTTLKVIKTIHQELTGDPHRFFTGATAIETEWRRRYPEQSPPPIRTIGQLLKELGLTSPRKHHRSKGAARYLCYPEHTIYHLLGGRLLEADFIGQKYLAGHSQPLQFIAFSFKHSPKLRYFQRVTAQTADVFTTESGRFFDRYETPEFLKVDNCLATIGSASGKRNLSKTMKFLLSHQVIPIFAVPRKPFSQASIEGNNSVFSRMFWNKRRFESPEQVDQVLDWFNRDSELYTGYQSPKNHRSTKNSFIPKIYFLRQVKEHPTRKQTAAINVLNEQINLPSEFINYFVLAEWLLDEERILVRFERDLHSLVIHEQVFRINERSKNIKLDR